MLYEATVGEMKTYWSPLSREQCEALEAKEKYLETLLPAGSLLDAVGAAEQPPPVEPNGKER